MNKEFQTADHRPCVGDLLWFMSHRKDNQNVVRMDNQNVVNVSVEDLMSAFNIDSYEAGELLEQIEYRVYSNRID